MASASPDCRAGYLPAFSGYRSGLNPFRVVIDADDYMVASKYLNAPRRNGSGGANQRRR